MFLRTGAFFSSILSEFLKNLVALHRELVQAMAEAYETPVYLGTYESDQLTPYTGQQICNFQYNFCVPVDSKELKCRLRFGIHSAMEFEGFYQLLISLGGHILFWR